MPLSKGRGGVKCWINNFQQPYLSKAAEGSGPPGNCPLHCICNNLHIIAKILFITHFTPLSPWRGVGGEAPPSPLGEGHGGEAVFCGRAY